MKEDFFCLFVYGFHNYFDGFFFVVIFEFCLEVIRSFVIRVGKELKFCRTKES